MKLSPKIADRISDCLSGGGPEMRASKAVNRYRQNPTARNAMAAEASLNELGKNKQTEIRQAARV